ncbi:MAG: hypothetical protein P8099_16540 [Gemmatimonadota bacterium]
MMEKRPEKLPKYSTSEGMQLALAYLNDPSDVACPRCGPETMEVVAFLDGDRLRSGGMVGRSPDTEYTVVLYCHACHRGAALELNRAPEHSPSPPHA